MLKQKFKRMLASSTMFIMALLMPAALTGCDKDSDINVRVDGEYVQWQVQGDDGWKNLITIDEVVDALGDDLKGETGADGKKVEFQQSSTHIQWRYEGGDWQNLIALDDIKSDDLIAEKCTITYDFNLGKSGNLQTNNLLLSVFDREGFTKVESEVVEDEIHLSYTSVENKGDYFKLFDFDEIGLADYFNGWFVENDKVSRLDVVGGNISLKAIWKKDLATVICNENVDYRNFDEQAMTVSAYPLKESSYFSSNGVKWFNLNELMIKDGKFYKISSFNRTAYNDSEILVNGIVIPESASNYFNSIMTTNWGSYLDCYFKTINSRKINDNITHYYVGDFVIIEDAQGSKGQCEYIYKVDYSLNEATLLQSYSYGANDSNVGSLRTNFVTHVTNFDVLVEGEKINIKITKINESWFKPFYQIACNETGFYDGKNIEINFVFGADINEIGNISHLFPSNLNNLTDFSGNNITIKIFSECNTKLFDNRDMSISTKDITIKYEFYIYSENQPDDNENLYWHYDIDNETPIIWE